MLSKILLFIGKCIIFPWTMHHWLVTGFMSGKLSLLQTVGLIITEVLLFCFYSLWLGVLLQGLRPLSDAVLITLGVLWGIFVLAVVVYLWVFPPYTLLNVFIRIGWTWVLCVCGVFQYLMMVMNAAEGN